MENFIENHCYQDVYRWRNPRKEIYTKITGRQERCIDNIYTTDDVAKDITICIYIYNPISDHNYMMEMTISDKKIKYGKGLWKCNITLLDSPLIDDHVKETIKHGEKQEQIRKT